MEITVRKRLARAGRDTRWFSLKVDLLPTPIAAIITGVLAGGVVDILPAVGVGVGAALAYWVLANGIEFVWNFMRSGERIARDEVIRLEGLVGDPDARKRATTAIEVLTSAQEEGLQRFKEAMELFRQSPTPNSEWVAARNAGIQWIVETKALIREHCPEHLGEFDNIPISNGGFFEEGDARRDRLAEVMRQLRKQLGLGA